MKKSGVGTLRTLILAAVVMANFTCRTTAGCAQTPTTSPTTSTTSTTPGSATDTTNTTPTGTRVVKIANETLNGVLELSSRFADPTAAAAVTAGNGYDQVYFKDDQGHGYVWYGRYPYVDALIKPGYVGSITVPGSNIPKIVTVVAVQNEINTAGEGIFDGWNDIKAILQSQGRLVMEAASLTAGGLFLRQMIRSGPFSLGNLTGSLRSVLMLIGKYKYHALTAAAVTIGLPVAWSLTKYAFRQIFQASQKERPFTIAQVTKDPNHPDDPNHPEAEQIARPIHVEHNQTRAMHAGEILSAIFLRTASTTTTTTSPGVDPNPGIMGFRDGRVPPRSPQAGRVGHADAAPGFERLENH